MKTLGLDIGTHAVKAVLLSRGVFGMRVVEATLQRVGDEEPETVARGLLSGYRDRADAVAVSLDRRLLATRELLLPFSDPAKVDQAFPYAAEGPIPMPLNEAFIDYRIEEVRPEGGSRVMVLAFPRASFEKRMEAMATIIDADPLYHIDAFANLNAHLEGEGGLAPPELVTGLLDVGATKACLDLLVGKKPVFTRTFLTAGNRVTETLADEMGISAEEAEAVKVEGLAAGDGAPRVVPPNVIQAATPVYSQLAQDVQHSLRAFHEKHPGLRLQRLYLTGGSSQATFLKTFLADHLGVEVRAQSPAPLVRAAGGATAALPFTSAYGLALWAAGVGQVHLDLIREKRPPLVLRPANLALLGAACGLLIAFHYYTLSQRFDALEGRRKSLESRIATEVTRIRRPPLPALPGTLTTEEIDRAIRDTEEQANRFALDDFSVLEVMDRLSSAIPAAKRNALQIEHVQVQGDEVTLGGRADSYEVVDDVKASLEGSGCFDDVRLGPLSGQRGGGQAGAKRLRFQILLKVKGARG